MVSRSRRNARARASCAFNFALALRVRSAPAGTAAAAARRSARDWRATSARGDVLTFTSPALDRDMEVTGQILAHLWIESTAPDTDVTARILDVAPDGRATALTNDMASCARYRSTEDPQPPSPLPRGEPVELTISPVHELRPAARSSDASARDGQPASGTRDTPEHLGALPIVGASEGRHADAPPRRRSRSRVVVTVWDSFT